ncbi:MAG TPA: hypothetical protein VGU45_02005 [Microvirga sp.]|jgi:hypothetical protein|nr:hypothetical protein [Microvirga sp.]
MGAAKADMMREDAVRLAAEENAMEAVSLVEVLCKLLEADSDDMSFPVWERERDAAVKEARALLTRIEGQTP